MFRQTLQQVARAEVGYIETPVNRTKYGLDYGLDGYPWCAMFVRWCYKQAAKRVDCENPLINFAHVTTSFERFKKAGWILGPGEKLLPGDILCWDHDDKPLGPGHTGLYISGNSIIEGNTSRRDKTSRNGGEVCIHVHSLADKSHGRLLGIARPTRKYGPI